MYSLSLTIVVAQVVVDVGSAKGKDNSSELYDDPGLASGVDGNSRHEV